MSLVPRNGSNSSLRNEHGDHDSTITFPQKTSCGFCSVSFKCDLDVARHLNSPTHRTKRDEHLSLLNKADKTLEKNIPTNLKKVYDSLKVRTVKDFHDLADKDYFSIPHESFMPIYDSLVDKLFASVVNYETKNLKDTSFRDKLLQTLESRKAEPERGPQTSSTTVAEGEDGGHSHEVGNQSRKKAKINTTTKSPNTDETTKTARQPPKSTTPANHSKQNTPAPSTRPDTPRGKAPSSSKESNREAASSSSCTSSLSAGASKATRLTKSKTPPKTSKNNIPDGSANFCASSSEMVNTTRQPKSSAPVNINTAAPPTNTSSRSSGVTTPVSGGSTMGQNWNHKFTFAKIKAEPKD